MNIENLTFYEKIELANGENSSLEILEKLSNDERCSIYIKSLVAENPNIIVNIARNLLKIKENSKFLLFFLYLNKNQEIQKFLKRYKIFL